MSPNSLRGLRRFITESTLFLGSYFDLAANLNIEMRGVPVNPVSAPVSSTYSRFSFSDPNNASAVGLLKSSGPPDFLELRNLPSVSKTSTSFDKPLVTYNLFAAASHVASGRFHAYLPQALTSHCRTNFPCRSNTCIRLFPVSATKTSPPPIAIPVDSRNCPSPSPRLPQALNCSLAGSKVTIRVRP